MGKYYDYYAAKYERAKAQKIRYPFIHHPHIWMLIAYCAEHGIDFAGDFEEQIACLKELDTEMYDTIMGSWEDIQKHPERYFGVIDNTPEDAPQGCKKYSIYIKGTGDIT